MVIERNTGISIRGVDVGHIGSKYHKSNGFDLDPRVATRYLHHASHQTTNYDLIYVWASRSGKVFDYIEELGAANGVSMVPALSGTAKYGNWSKLSDNWRVYPDAVSFVRGGETYDMRDDGQPVNITLGELVYDSAKKNGAEFVFERAPSSWWAMRKAASRALSQPRKTASTCSTTPRTASSWPRATSAATRRWSTRSVPSRTARTPTATRRPVQQRRRPAHGHVGRRGHVEERSRPMIHQFTLDTLEFNLTSFIMSWLAVTPTASATAPRCPSSPC